MPKVRALPLELQDLIVRYGDARVADSWKGSKEPESYQEIEKDLKDAYNQLYKAILKAINE